MATKTKESNKKINLLKKVEKIAKKEISFSSKASKKSIENKNTSKKDKKSPTKKGSSTKKISSKVESKIPKNIDTTKKDKSKIESKALKNTKKASTKKTKAKVDNKTLKNTTTKKTKKAPTKVSKKEPSVVEYYNLPYRYNETIVKILYQTPDTLFVYWDISDKDRENYIKEYGKNFFNITYPVLIIHNDTMNYSFELPINDFANSWYIKVNDSKCDYRVELGRRPKYNDASAIEEIKENIQTNYIYVSTSNEIELPNDHVLLTTNANNTIKYRNVKTKQEKDISIYDIIKDLPLIENSEIPLFNKEILEGLYSAIYKNEDVSFFERINNPSSGNSSSSMPHS